MVPLGNNDLHSRLARPAPAPSVIYIIKDLRPRLGSKRRRGLHSIAEYPINKIENTVLIRLLQSRNSVPKVHFIADSRPTITQIALQFSLNCKVSQQHIWKTVQRKLGQTLGSAPRVHFIVDSRSYHRDKTKKTIPLSYMDER